MHDEVECALSPTHWSQKFHEVKFDRMYKISPLILEHSQADYLLLYEQNWLKEGTEGLVLKKTADSSK